MTEIRKNSTEVIRVERREFKGNDRVHVRVWFDDGTGEYKPSPKGLSLRLETWEELLPLIKDALENGG